MEKRHTGNSELDTLHAQAGLKERLAAIYDKYAAGLFRYALILLADRSAAEDALQQIFTKLAIQGERLTEITSYNSYLRTAVRNECYRILNKRRKSEISIYESIECLEAVDKKNSNQEQKKAVELAFCSLSHEQREVVHMKIYEQMTLQQIADQLQVSINTVASRYRYAIEKLRERLDSHRKMEVSLND